MTMVQGSSAQPLRMKSIRSIKNKGRYSPLCHSPSTPTSVEASNSTVLLGVRTSKSLLGVRTSKSEGVI